MNIYIIYSDDFAERIAGNLINMKNFCEVCELRCERETCRGTYSSFASNIYGLEKIMDDLPPFIEDPEKFLSDNFPTGIDILILTGIHPDLLSVMPEFAEINKIKALIIPVEDGNWVKFGLEKSIQKECMDRNIEVAFPRPACSLDYSNQPILDNFIDYFKIGKPKVKLYLDNDRVMAYKVINSAPCGSTWYVCRQVLGKSIEELNENVVEIISQAHHGYPCTASMNIDSVLKDTNLHIAGYLIREAIFNELKKNPKFNPRVITTETII